MKDNEIKRENWELRDQKHLMCAEGCQYEKPKVREIVLALKTEGYRPRNLEVSHDDIQDLWRWHCHLLKM